MRELLQSLHSIVRCLINRNSSFSSLELAYAMNNKQQSSKENFHNISAMNRDRYEDNERRYRGRDYDDRRSEPRTDRRDDSRRNAGEEYRGFGAKDGKKPKYSLKNVNFKLSDKDKKILAASKARKMLKKSRSLEETIGSKTRELGSSYLRATSEVAEGSGIVSNKLKFVALTILMLVALILFVGYYLNTSNPLTPVIEASKQPFSVRVIDRNNVRIFSATNPKTSVVRSLPNGLVDSLIALHGTLEYAYQAKTGNEVFAAEGNQSTTTDQEGQPLDSMELNLEGSENTEGADAKGAVLQGAEKVKGLFENKKCYIYRTLNEFGSYSCRYSYPNFLIHDFLRDVTDSSIVSKIVGYSETAKNYLLISWIEGNIDSNAFLDIYFNYVTYGNTFLGLEGAAKGYFNKSYTQLNLAESVYLMDIIYKNNKNLYPYFQEIGHKEIVEQLVRNGVVSNEELKPLLDEIEAIQYKAPIGMFSIYLTDIFGKALDYMLKDTVVTVKTTFASSLQNASVSMMEGPIRNLSIPNGSIVVLSGNEVLAGTTFSVSPAELPNTFEKKFYSQYPNVISYNVIKPFIYYAMVKNGADIPIVLLNAKYQNLLFSEYRVNKKQNPKANSVKDPKLAERLKSLNSNVEALTKTDLDVVPEEIRKMFAMQLSNMERGFVSSLTTDKYMKTLNSMFINTEVADINTFFDSGMEVRFIDVVKAYSALAMGGGMYPAGYIMNINGNSVESEDYALGNIENAYVNVLNNVFFNDYTPRGKKTQFKYIVDTNMAFAYADGYTVGIWLGDLKNPSLSEDYTTILESLLRDVVGLLPVA